MGRRAWGCCEDGKVHPSLPQAALGYPALHSKAVSHLLIAKRDCSNTAVPLWCLINGGEDLCMVSALSKCQCLAHQTSKQAGCGLSPERRSRCHRHAPLPAHPQLQSPGWCLNHQVVNAEAFLAQEQHVVGSWFVAGAGRRWGSTNIIDVNGSLLMAQLEFVGMHWNPPAFPLALGFFFIDSLITFVSAAYLGGFAMNCIRLLPLWQYLLC